MAALFSASADGLFIGYQLSPPSGYLPKEISSLCSLKVIESTIVVPLLSIRPMDSPPELSLKLL